MSFIAGVIGREETLEESQGLEFERALARMETVLPWKIQRVKSRRSLLAQGGFNRLWRGPTLEVNTKYDAVAQGVQWKEVPASESVLPYLVKAFLAHGGDLEDCFDFFHFVGVNKAKDRIVVATDSLGLFPLYYILDRGRLVFSSHQTFCRLMLGGRFRINWQGVLEYLSIGHNIGEKTILKEIRVLPAGGRLVCEQRKAKIFAHPWPSTADPFKGLSLEEASEIVFAHLVRKRDSYARMASRPFLGFLSGGWDSRLLISLFSKTGKLGSTYTTQQQIRYGGRLVSEKKIAEEVARHVGVRNRFVAPVYKSPANAHERAQILDYSTWFHDWAMTLVESLPRDRYIFLDGLMGDVLLRGLHLSSELRDCMEREDRKGAALFLHDQYLKGFNPYTRGIEQWRPLFLEGFSEGYSSRLLEDVSNEITGIGHKEFATLFLLRNRTRRAISPLPGYLFGRKGTVVLPFCNPGFLRVVLSIPLSLRSGPALYKDLLEKCKPGLSRIASTNSEDPEELEPYLVASVRDLTGIGRVLCNISPSLPFLPGLLNRARNRGAKRRTQAWVRKVIQNPPEHFMEVLAPEIKRAIRREDEAALVGLRFFLDKIWILETFFKDPLPLAPSPDAAP